MLTPCEELGLRIRTARMARGFSLRSLTHAIGLAAHSNLASYERGERIIPPDLLRSIEQALDLPDSSLEAWRVRALQEKAVSNGLRWRQLKLAEHRAAT